MRISPLRKPRAITNCLALKNTAVELRRSSVLAKPVNRPSHQRHRDPKHENSFHPLASIVNRRGCFNVRSKSVIIRMLADAPAQRCQSRKADRPCGHQHPARPRARRAALQPLPEIIPQTAGTLVRADDQRPGTGEDAARGLRPSRQSGFDGRNGRAMSASTRKRPNRCATITDATAVERDKA